MRKKKAILSILLALCLAAAMMPMSAYAAEDVSNDIVVIYTGDMHGAVDSNITLAGLKAYANERQAKSRYLEIVDAGDALSGNAIANASGGKFVVEAMNEVGYGIAVPGVHDFDFGVTTLTDELASLAKFQYVSCNFADIETGKTVFKPYEIVTYGKTKIAYVGISDPMTISKSITSFTEGNGTCKHTFRLGSNGKYLYSIVQNAVDMAKEDGADYVIAIGHLDSNGDRAYSPKGVISNTTGINAFIAGNAHSPIVGQRVKDKKGNTVLLTSAGSGLRNIGALTITPGKNISSQLISNYGYRYIKTNDAIESLMQKYSYDLKKSFAVSEVKLKSADSSGVRIVGRSETNLGDLCADAYRAATGADIAFVEASEIQGEIVAGDISYNDIVKAMPSNGDVSMFTVSGGEILDALEMAARLFPVNNEGFLQVSGITFDIQETVKSSVTVDEKGNFTGVKREYRVTNVMVGGKELDLMGDYTVAATEAFLTGKTGYTMFEEVGKKISNITTDNQALYQYIAKELKGKVPAVYSEQAGRIDYIKLARQSQIDAEIEAGVAERMENYSEEMAALREEIAIQKEIIAVKSVQIKASSALQRSGSKRKVKLSWRLSEKVDGLKYQIYKSQKRNSGYKKCFTTSKQTFTNTSGLKKGKTYYYKVRGYKYLGGKYYYTAWSNVSYRKIS